MSTEQKLIENLTAQLELKDRLLDNAEAQIKTLTEQATIYEGIRITDDTLIKHLEAEILKVKSKSDK